ncbi:40414_t:CDS:2 [Gigaspora margarita]|uniref:40414_t:CDS:1 n=1 Tax=Gigaspora margarita TaxID=4874 RepID=A0ABN7V7Y6_GIGMA|nr:40414_t:CDS:2 [Gigaspora margarita]
MSGGRIFPICPLIQGNIKYTEMYKSDDQKPINSSKIITYLKKSHGGRIPARTPNAFIIYGKVYVETARENGYHLPMTIVSSMASQSWESADETVKAEYRRIAKKVRNEIDVF